MKKQSGFTLIELVVVIVILGILAAAAVPRFVNLSDEANDAAVQGVAGALTSGSNINYAAELANAGGVGGTTVTACTSAAANALLQGGLPTGYSIGGSAVASTTLGEVYACTVFLTADNTVTANWTLIAVP